MDLTVALLVITGALTVLYLWCKHHFNYWRRKGIPYIEPTLVIGNTKESFTVTRNFGLHLCDLYNDPKMAKAPVVGIFAFNQPGLVIRDTELVKSVLIKDFNKFNNRYGTCDPHGDPLGSNNLFFVRSPHWKDIRSKISPVFTSGKIKQMYPLMLEVAADLETHLASYSKKGNYFETEVKEVCARFTTDMIATIAFGVRANSLENPNAEFRVQGRKMFTFTFSRAFDFFVAFFLPKWVSFFRVKVFTKEFTHFLRSTIHYVMAERERTGTLRNDLIDILVALKKDAIKEHPEYFAKDPDFLVAQAAVFFTAGFETSSSTMSFALYELAKQPDLQDRLRSEICDAFIAENGKISHDTITSMEYLGMVIDEVLRLYPILPFLDREHMKIQGESPFSLKPFYDYTLPYGMPVFIPVYGLQRDPQYWPNPDNFDPERFSSENRKNINAMAYMPFGTGPHNCIGSRIGLLQAKIGIVHFLKNHYVTVCDKTIKKMEFDPKSFILQCAEGINLKVINDNMYENQSK